MSTTTTTITRLTPGPIPQDATQFKVPMRDGIRLATDMYFSSQAEELPVVLIRLPYDKNGEYCFMPAIARYFTAYGYHVAVQDVRGKFRSEGQTLLCVNEVDDSTDTIDWLAQQPYCNGSVAMWGDSYYGYTQLAAAAGAHPALKAIAPRVTGSGLGAPRSIDSQTQTGDVEMGITYLYPMTHFLNNDTYEWDVDWNKRPFIDQIDNAIAEIGDRSETFDLWYPAEVQLPRFPRGSAFSAPAVPMLHTIGWWDNIAPVAWRDHREIQQHYPAWQQLEHLRIESIDHENNFLGENRPNVQRTNDQIQALLPRMIDPALEFFDVYVKSRGSAADIPKVRYNIAHTDGFYEADSWPPPRLVAHQFAAQADGTLSPVGEPESPASSSRPEIVAWTHDPDNPVPSSAEDAFAYLFNLPDEAQRAHRSDVLAFSSDPLQANSVLAGPVTVNLKTASSGPNMDVHVWLLDLDTEGVGTRIARGNLHLAKAPASIDDAIVNTVDLFEVGYLLKAGHRLQLQLASSDAPEFLCAPGDGSDPLSARNTVTNKQQVQLGGTDGLQVKLHTLAETASTESITAGATLDCC